MNTSNLSRDTTSEEQLIEESLGIGAAHASRAAAIIMQAEVDPDNSVTSLSLGAILSVVPDRFGYRQIWEIFYSGFLIEIGEHWDSRARRIIDIRLQPVS